MVKHFGPRLRSTVLKASHHGRDSGYDLEAARVIEPEAIVVSVGRKPDTDASGKYRGQYGSVRSTRFQGNVHLTIRPRRFDLEDERNG
jgi:competence protein ComEC